MAFFNEIGAGRYNRFLQKLFNMKGGPPARSIGSDVFVVFPFFSGSENRVLETWRLWAQSQSVAASAGNLSAARLRNVKGSNVVAVIEKILVTTVSAATGVVVDVLPDPGTNLASLRTPVPRDLRQSGSSNLICTDGNPATQTAGDQQVLFATLTTNQDFDFITMREHEIVLPPGFALELFVLNANTNLAYNVVWRERALEDSELSAA